jgi:hypothetical protein
VDHSGAPRKGAFVPPGHPAALVSHPHAAAKVHSGMADVTNVHAAMGKAPQPKRAHLTTAPLHNGMATRSRHTGQSHFGGDALSRADSNPANPLTGPSREKRIDHPPKPVIGQRSRATDMLHGGLPGENHARGVGRGVNTDLGAAILAEAYAVAGPDHPANMGIGVLPQSVKEN